MSALPLLETAMQSVLGQSDDAAASLVAAAMGLWLIFGLFALAMLAFMIFCWWRIFEKAGYGGP